MNSKQWYNNDSLKNIDMQKMLMLQELMKQSNGKKTSDMLPFLMAASRQANSKGMNFSKEEMQLIINVLKKDMSPAEQERTSKMLSILGF
ncbi:hypothetical protein [Candidatus Galacturonibacter soehngenii]|uniref:Uncharacterized protein n=1 Tax=Candidatus Galacturonatibacter soehngenii TaxID=2307010 RepID=A0A7V7QMG0_9FIRM|nr:hypothetical protein [Candidatus Galacturonibacter soehngenii]KAB1439413.1 hypothetical protein F7O84_03170 [Candidatus Galacturonibacter soehngenii]MBA4687275.1 hypothetical protein [Candidatus Galacturonibacter soehngenii]